MENASKALIIAGSILVSIMIVSLGVLIFNRFSSSAKPNLDEEEIESFNSPILKYIGDRISGSQVNALIQLVVSIDTASINEGDAKRIKLTYKNNDEIESVEVDSSENLTRTLRRVDTGPSNYYTVVDEEYSDLGLINKITITKNGE